MDLSRQALVDKDQPSTPKRRVENRREGTTSRWCGEESQQATQSPPSALAPCWPLLLPHSIHHLPCHCSISLVGAWVVAPPGGGAMSRISFRRRWRRCCERGMVCLGDSRSANTESISLSVQTCARRHSLIAACTIVLPM